MSLFGAAHGWWGAKRLPLPKISHTYPTMTKLGTAIPYLKDTTFSSPDISMFSPENSKFCYIKKYRYRFHFGT